MGLTFTHNKKAQIAPVALPHCFECKKGISRWRSIDSIMIMIDESEGAVQGVQIGHVNPSWMGDFCEIYPGHGQRRYVRHGIKLGRIYCVH